MNHAMEGIYYGMGTLDDTTRDGRKQYTPFVRELRERVRSAPGNGAGPEEVAALEGI